MTRNTLYYGDNLSMLCRHIDNDSIDLIYIDPPFQSGKDYSILLKEQDGTKTTTKIQAFKDTWGWNIQASKSYDEVMRKGGPAVDTLEAFRRLLGPTPMLAYILMMAPRLLELRRTLRPTGSIYLHCDSVASSHLRLLMDAVFGQQNFRNEIIWYYYNKMHDRRKRLFPRATDTLLFYVKDVTADFTYKQLKELRDKPVKQLARKRVGGRMVNVKDEDGHVVYRIKEDRIIDNVWRIPTIQPADRTQRMGYPTQKPEALLARVIESSSNPGDIVLDPFCGCGTTIAVAQRLERQWIGIDNASLAIRLTKQRLLYSFDLQARQDYSFVSDS